MGDIYIITTKFSDNDTSCENKRLCELFLDCAERPFKSIKL